MKFERPIRNTDYLLNKGYHYFNKEFVFFRADTSIGANKVNLVMGVQNYKYKSNLNDSLLERKHRRYTITDIHFKIKPEYLGESNFKKLVNDFKQSVNEGEIDSEGYHKFLSQY